MSQAVKNLDNFLLIEATRSEADRNKAECRAAAHPVCQSTWNLAQSPFLRVKTRVFEQYRPRPISEADLTLIRRLVELHLMSP